MRSSDCRKKIGGKMVNDNKRPIISVAFKSRKRIRIHRITLHLLGDPEYIQFLVNPETKMIAIRRGCSSDHLAIRVYPLDSQTDCFEIRSLFLIKSLNMVCKDWKDGNSYRIVGNMDAKNKTAYFRLDGAEQEGDNT